MKKSYYCLFSFLTFIQLSAGAECSQNVGRYGNGIHFQDIACVSIINEKTLNEKVYRTLTLNDDGALQVMSSSNAATLSASMGFRVFYLLPLKTKREIQSFDESHLQITHPSGVQFNFDKYGNVTSPDLKMTVANSVNLANKGGVEIESFPKGIVIDIGYRIGKSPSQYENKMVTITDKHQKKCTVNNSELFKVTKYDADFIYKTNMGMYRFLEKKCSGLDLSDFLASEKDGVRALTHSSDLGSAPKEVSRSSEDDSKREVKGNTSSEKSFKGRSDQLSSGR